MRQFILQIVPLCQLALRFKIYWITTEFTAATQRKTWPAEQGWLCRYYGCDTPCVPVPAPALKRAESTKSRNARRSILKNRRPFCCFYPFLEFDAFHLIICVREEQKQDATAETTSRQAGSNHKWLQGSSSTGIHLRLPCTAPFPAPCPLFRLVARNNTLW